MGEYKCKECRDTGWILSKDETGHEYARPCKCRMLEEARKRFERSGLATQFRNKNFDNYITSGNCILEDAKSQAEKYAREFEPEGHENLSILFSGQVGAGKTHLGTAISQELINREVPVLYMPYRDALTSLKQNILNEEEYARQIHKFMTAEVLFMDDLLKGKVTEADINILYEIVNYRYNNSLPMIVSTEKTVEQLLEFDEAIGSRILEMSRGYVISFKGALLNYRLYGKAV
ncbi:MAG: ATP-binding protein [Lachnospiraceae bacterium]|jgi:DNA replication protein DnaC|nr:ATP-binding protein [Lachnospiraceae bacterium]